MADFNRVLLLGRLTRDAEMIILDGSRGLFRFSIAVNRHSKKNDEWVSEPHYFDCVYFYPQMDKMSPFLKKGLSLFLEGQLQQNRWESDGQKRSKIEVLVKSLQFLGSPNSQNNTASSYEGSRSSSQEKTETNKSANFSPYQNKELDSFEVRDNFEEDFPF